MSSEARKKLRFCDYDAFGFDIDHTLAKYNIPHLFDQIYHSLATYLVEKRGYDDSLLKPLDKDFVMRGVIFDIDRGNFLKLSEKGTILRASHGTKFMSVNEIKACYGNERHWSHFEELIENVNNIGERFRIFENFFDIPIAMISARAIDFFDSRDDTRPGCYDCWPDIISAVMDTYYHVHFDHNKGNFFPQWKAETSLFVQKANDSLKRWMKKLRENNKTVFVLTSSFNDFALASMEFVFGSDWKNYCDLVLTFARKPSFFKKENSFLRVAHGKEAEEVDCLNTEDVFSQGNPKPLISYLEGVTGSAEPKILFFGDSLRSDVYPAKKFSGWDTMLILEELVAEQHCFEPEVDVEPAGKKKRVEEPPQLEKDCLTSHSWGSFFTDNIGSDSSVEQDNQHTVKSMNTLWGYIVRKYADVVIPQLDYVTDLSLEHEFEIFNHEEPHQWGFYPGLPLSLQT